MSVSNVSPANVPASLEVVSVKGLSQLKADLQSATAEKDADKIKKAKAALIKAVNEAAGIEPTKKAAGIVGAAGATLIKKAVGLAGKSFSARFSQVRGQFQAVMTPIIPAFNWALVTPKSLKDADINVPELKAGGYSEAAMISAIWKLFASGEKFEITEKQLVASMEALGISQNNDMLLMEDNAELEREIMEANKPAELEAA